MKLPDYFIADLPPDATLTAEMISEARRTLKRNREKYIAARSTESIVKVLSEVAANWLDPDFPFRKLAMEHGPTETGFSQPTLARGLDSFFKQLTRENFHRLQEQDLGHADCVTSDACRVTTRAPSSHYSSPVTCHFWQGPEFLVHITAGSIPNPALMSIVLGVLVRSAQFVKCASGSSFLPRLFAHSIHEADAKLGACIEIAEWRGGNAGLETALFTEADCVTATGGDETLSQIRQCLPVKTRFLGYGHRVSFGYVTRDSLADLPWKNIVGRAADDVVAWDQLGCLSPHTIYVEHGGRISAERFAEMLAEELERREKTEPRRKLSPEAAATIASRRRFYEVRAANSDETRLWQSKNSTAWTVVYEADAQFQASCLNRFVYVKGAADLTRTLQAADNVRGKVSTVGLVATNEQAEKLAMELARWGVTRICPLGEMQNPPLTWHHDGRPTLGDLVTRTDWEKL